MCTQRGGNQNVTCRDSDSELLQKLIIDKYNKNIYLTSGKDLDNRFFTQQLPEDEPMPRMAVVGRSGNSPLAKVLPKAVMVQEYFQKGYTRAKCSIDYNQD